MGKELRDYAAARDDLRGHGAIRYFYGLKGGENVEYRDFSSPSNFPVELITKIIDGEFSSWFGFPPEGILNEELYAEHGYAAKQLFEDYHVRSTPYRYVDFERKLRELESYYWLLIRDPLNRTSAWREMK